MNIREAAERIKSTVPMGDILAMYGMQPGRGGFIRCPFHSGDHTASLKVYNGEHGWSCFGCHAGGTVIDFVMRMDELDFADAVRKINDEFNLDLLRAVGFSAFIQKKKDESADRKLYDAQMARLKADNDEQEWQIDRYREAWMDIDAVPVPERSSSEWDWWLQLREDLPMMEMQLAHNRQREEVTFYEWQVKRDSLCAT